MRKALVITTIVVAAFCIFTLTSGAKNLNGNLQDSQMSQDQLIAQVFAR